MIVFKHPSKWTWVSGYDRNDRPYKEADVSSMIGLDDIDSDDANQIMTSATVREYYTNFFLACNIVQASWGFDNPRSRPEIWRKVPKQLFMMQYNKIMNEFRDYIFEWHNGDAPEEENDDLLAVIVAETAQVKPPTPTGYILPRDRAPQPPSAPTDGMRRLRRNEPDLDF